MQRSKLEPFEKHVDRYEQWFVRNRFAYESELSAVRSMLPARGIGLEIGIGTGRFAGPLGLKIGVDPSRAMGIVARQRGAEVIQAVAEALPFMDESFDFALMVTTLCFLDDVDLSFQEARRVLKRGGKFIVGFVDRDSPLGKAYQSRKSKSPFYREARFHSVQEVASSMQYAGFERLAFAQTIFRDLQRLRSPDTVRQGHGEGSFIVLRGTKSVTYLRSKRSRNHVARH